MAFDTTPRSELWKRMIEIEMPLEYRVAIARLNEEVRCIEKIGIGLLFEHMGGNQQCPLSPTLFIYALIK